MTGPIQRLTKALDKQIELFLLGSGGRRQRDQELADHYRPLKRWLSRFVWLGIVLAAVVKVSTFNSSEIDLFILPIMLGCSFLGRGRFVLVLVTAAVSFAASCAGHFIYGTEANLWVIGRQTLTLIGIWSLVGSVVVITLDKWKSLKRIQKRRDEDLELARTLQTSLLPRDLKTPGVSLRGSIHQCESVGGDFFYFAKVDDSRTLFCLGDVMGKGVCAGLLMAMVMNSIYDWGKSFPDPSQIARKLSHRISGLWNGERGWFITLFYAVFDEEREELEFCAAGQQGAYLLREGVVRNLCDGCDLPLGVVRDCEFTTHKLEIRDGDQILLFSDGVYEARSPSGELYGEERLRSFFREQAQLESAHSLVKRIESSILEFTGGVYTDDTTLLHFRYRAH